MALTPPHADAKNARLAIFESGVSRASVAAALNISRRTLYNKFVNGHFTIAELRTIAELTGTNLLDLLPDAAKSATA